MTSGALLLIGIALAAWFLARAIDRTEQARTSRGVQLCAFLVGMLGAATPMVLVIVELVARTTANEVVAAVAFIALCLRRDRLIWRKRDEGGADDVPAR
jgi:hypothetical protein